MEEDRRDRRQQHGRNDHAGGIILCEFGDQAFCVRFFLRSGFHQRENSRNGGLRISAFRTNFQNTVDIDASGDDGASRSDFGRHGLACHLGGVQRSLALDDHAVRGLARTHRLLLLRMGRPFRLLALTAQLADVVLDLVEDLEVAEYDTNTGMKTGGMTDLTTLMDVKKIKNYAKAVHANGGVVICSLTLSAPWILTKLEPYCDAILVNFASVTELAGLSELVTVTDLQLQVLSGAIMPTGKLPVTLPSCTAVLEVTDTEIDGVVYELCASPNDVPGYDKDQYIAPEVLAQSPSGSYAYQDEDGNTYKVWFGLTY